MKLRSKKDKDSKIKINKITSYIDNLCEFGLKLEEPYIKHIDDEIWELRPIRDRILFATWCDNRFILLSVFVKKTQKTPKSEIEKAKRLLNDYRERIGKNE